MNNSIAQKNEKGNKNIKRYLPHVHMFHIIDTYTIENKKWLSKKVNSSLK